ncbi:MAG TPA: hypothetical protein VFW64_12235 [Pseudonocardiaceae bacterium]|nr:hypothetical protein [Pseudonocardiaceae bacterium]
MSFTVRTVTQTFANADGTPASGKVTFDLSGRMTNGGTTILPNEVTAPLDGSGAMTVTLAANDDTGTLPAGVQWRVTVRILGAEEESYFVTVPSAGSGSIDLGSLLPSAQQVT